MANFVVNTIRVTDKIEEFKKALLDINEGAEELSIVDFNKVTPQPKELDIESGSGSWQEDMQYYSVEELNLAKHMLPILNGAFNKTFTQEAFVEKVLNETIFDNTFMSKLNMEYFCNSLDKAKEEITTKAQGFYNLKTYEATDWYAWRTQNWGTKWNASTDSCYVSENSNGLFIEFQTAWDTPLPIFEKLAERFNFSVAYSDEDRGNENMGILTFKDGKLASEDYFDDLNDDERYIISCLIWGERDEALAENMDDYDIKVSDEKYDELEARVNDYLM